MTGSSSSPNLGAGPMRFAPAKGERSIEAQIAALTPEERKCFVELKTKWEKSYPNKPFSNLMYLRFARCSPGSKKFKVNASWKVMKKFDRRYVSPDQGAQHSVPSLVQKYFKK